MWQGDGCDLIVSGLSLVASRWDALDVVVIILATKSGSLRDLNHVVSSSSSPVASSKFRFHKIIIGNDKSMGGARGGSDK